MKKLPAKKRTITDDKNGSLGNKPRTGFYVACEICGKESYYKPFAYKNRRHFYCSDQCRMESFRKPQTTLLCNFCGKEYLRGPSYIKWQAIRNVSNHYCSISCGARARGNGADHPLWRGGVSRAYQYGYHSTEYMQWHQNVFIRDNFTCQLCDTRGTYLHAHHIKGFSHFPDLRFVVSNGITLCKTCHMEVHSKQCELPESPLTSYLQAEAMEDRKRKKGSSRMTTCSG